MGWHGLAWVGPFLVLMYHNVHSNSSCTTTWPNKKAMSNEACLPFVPQTNQNNNMMMAFGLN
jgi:hypothetical protein